MNKKKEDNHRPDHFNIEYYSTRKYYSLYAGLLLATELFGIRIGAQPLKNFDLTLLSPNALPYIFIILIAYYGIRYTIEWYQSDSDRRKTTTSKFDFNLTHGISALAISTFLVQRFGRLQLLNFDKNSTVVILFTSILTIAYLFMIYVHKQQWKARGLHWWKDIRNIDKVFLVSFLICILVLLVSLIVKIIWFSS